MSEGQRTRITGSLEALFNPASIAIIGASDDPTRIGGRPLAYLKTGGYKGGLYPVNPKRPAVQGVRAYEAIAAIGAPVDLAIIALPADQALAAATECAKVGVRSAAIFSSGFAEIGGEGAVMQQQLTALCRETGMRVLGPNCLGLFNASIGAYATFTTSLDRGLPSSGPISIVSQSGAFGSHLFYVSKTRGLGMRVFAATGNEADVDVAECIGWLARDDGTRVIMAYIEGVQDARRLRLSLEAARRKGKPVIVMKVGRSEAGAEAVSSHTAALAGSDAVFSAVLQKHGAWRARTAEEMVDIAYAASFGCLPASRRLGVVTISGGGGALIADAAAERGLELPPMPADAQKAMKAIVPFASPVNPIDITAQPFNDIRMVRQNLEIVAERGGYDAILLFFTMVAGSAAIARPVLDAIKEMKARIPDCALMASCLLSDELKRAYEEAGVPVFEDPTRAVDVLAALAGIAAGLRENAEIGAEERPVSPDLSGPVGEHEAKRMLAPYGIRTPAETLARTADEAATAAIRHGGKVVLKIASPDIAHKTEAGGVRLGLSGGDAVRAAFGEIIANAKRYAPQARIDGVLVSPMLEGGIETIVGVKRDPVFGPVIAFGLGGILVEVLKDVTLRLAPVSEAEALAMTGEIRGGAILDGVRGKPPADRAALAKAIAGLSRFAAEHAGSLDSVEVNPLLVMPGNGGAFALDALIVPLGRAQ